MFELINEEIVTNSLELMVYFFRFILIELVLPLSIFIAVMLTLLVDWSWIPISSFERVRGKSLSQIKKNLIG